jgi:hypothetical protein
MVKGVVDLDRPKMLSIVLKPPVGIEILRVERAAPVRIVPSRCPDVDKVAFLQRIAFRPRNLG